MLTLCFQGGGRAISFFADNQVHFEEGRAVSKMIEVKGGGTTKLQPEIPKKATGFLCLVTQSHFISLLANFDPPG